MIRTPYLLMIGDEPDRKMAKTASGVIRWRPDACLGQLRFGEHAADLGIPNLSVSDAAARGARTILIGTSPVGGKLPSSWVEVLLEALERGLDIAAGLHVRIADIPRISEAADLLGRKIFDVRHSNANIPIGTGEKRSGRRLLTVGTDCAVGKMFAALAIDKEMRNRGIKSTFRASGQTGILISGDGISVDCVVSDFISGAAEVLSPTNDDDHWDVIEGQGSLSNPSFAGVSLGLLHGSQPDAIVVCHEAGRKRNYGADAFCILPLQDCIDLNLELGSLTNSSIRCVGVSVNTSSLSDQKAHAYLSEQQDLLGLPTVDPIRTGVGAIVDKLFENDP